MKRIIALLLTVIICLCMAACGKAPEPEQSPQEPHTVIRCYVIWDGAKEKRNEKTVNCQHSAGE